MVATPNINANEARGVVVAAASPDIRTNLATAMTVFNMPTEFIQANQLVTDVVYRASNEMRVNSAVALVVCRGRNSSPLVKVWTFTIDGHDFYVLQLQRETLVYDLSTQRWFVWGSSDGTTWRAVHGLDWKADLGQIQMFLGQDLAKTVVGDDTTGALYFLGPEHNEDDYTDRDGSYPFQRVMHAQLITRGRDYLPVNGVILTGSVGETSDSTETAVELLYSDDRGHTYVSAGEVDVTVGSYDTRVEWRSLGSIKQPGRLIKIVDWGGIHRIDGLDIPDAT